MHIGWNRIWKVLLGCACVIGSIVLLACGQVGWGIAALEAAVLLLALQYAPRAAQKISIIFPAECTSEKFFSVASAPEGCAQPTANLLAEKS